MTSFTELPDTRTAPAVRELGGTIASIKLEINALKQSIQAANKSSEKLSNNLNRITLIGAVIAGAGVLTAIVSLVFEIYKWFSAKYFF